ncbi:MAG: hypothetical protein HY506_02690, partial [Candidatus Yanofskybacteria bacterium]|nr:hypothetical protein [Candidatus Yanofskybacteria bacterium]
MDSGYFYTFLFVHLVSLIIGFGSVLVVDFWGILWLRKKINTGFLAKIIENTTNLIWLGWTGSIASGIGLIVMKGYVDNLTKLKLFFVAMIGINGIFLHSVQKILAKNGEAPLPPKLKFRIALGSMISQISWWGAIFIGFIHRHWQHYIP